MAWLMAINPGSGNTPPSTLKAIELGDQRVGNTGTGDKLYVPSGSCIAIKEQVKVIDADKDSPAFNTVIASITVGQSPGNTHAGPDGKVVMAPNSGANTVSVIDTETDMVIDT